MPRKASISSPEKKTRRKRRTEDGVDLIRNPKTGRIVSAKKHALGKQNTFVIDQQIRRMARLMVTDQLDPHPLDLPPAQQKSVMSKASDSGFYKIINNKFYEIKDLNKDIYDRIKQFRENLKASGKSLATNNTYMQGIVERGDRALKRATELEKKNRHDVEAIVAALKEGPYRLE